MSSDRVADTETNYFKLCNVPKPKLSPKQEANGLLIWSVVTGIFAIFALFNLSLNGALHANYAGSSSFCLTVAMGVICLFASTTCYSSYRDKKDLIKLQESRYVNRASSRRYSL